MRKECRLRRESESKTQLTLRGSYSQQSGYSRVCCEIAIILQLKLSQYASSYPLYDEAEFIQATFSFQADFIQSFVNFI